MRRLALLVAILAAPLAVARAQGSQVPIWDTPPPPVDEPPKRAPAAAPSGQTAPPPQDFTSTQAAFPSSPAPAPEPAPAAPQQQPGFDMSTPAPPAPTAPPLTATPAPPPAPELAPPTAPQPLPTAEQPPQALAPPVAPLSLPTDDLPPPVVVEPRLGCPTVSPRPGASESTAAWYKPTDADAELAWNRIDPWERASSFSFEGFVGPGASDWLLEYEYLHGGMFSLYVGQAYTHSDLFLEPGTLIGVGFQFIAPIRLHDFRQPDIQIALLLPDWRIGFISNFDKFYGLWTSLVLTGVRVTFVDAVKLEVKLLQPGAYLEADLSNNPPAYLTNVQRPQAFYGLSAGLGAGADLGVIF